MEEGVETDMRPPACVQCKWGTGTTCEKPANTGAAKEMADKLKQMMAEREKQDAKWCAPATTQTALRSTVKDSTPETK